MQAIGDQPIRNNSSSAARITARVLECLAKASIKYNSFIMLPCQLRLLLRLQFYFQTLYGVIGLGELRLRCLHAILSVSSASCRVISDASYHTISDVSYHVISDVCRCLLISRRFRWAMHQLPRQLNDGIVASKRCASCLGSSTILSMLRNDC